MRPTCWPSTSPGVIRKQGLSPKATAIAMQALADAYNTYTEVDRMSDIERLVRAGEVHRRDLARPRGRGRRPAQPRPDPFRPGPVRPGDRRVRGDPPPIERSGSRRRRDSVPRHWAKSRVLERLGDAADGRGRGPEGRRRSSRAALKARQEAGVGQTDPGLVGNVGDLAIVLTETGKPAEALQLLDPIVKVAERQVRDRPTPG